jgi:hypothetical protein
VKLFERTNTFGILPMMTYPMQFQSDLGYDGHRCFFWVVWEDEKPASQNFSLLDFLATSIFFKATWEKLKMLLSVREFIQY